MIDDIKKYKGTMMNKKIIGFIMGTIIASGALSADPVKVTLDDDGVTRINGKRTFIYGTYRDLSDTRESFDCVKKAKFNMSHSYFFEGITPIAKKYSQKVIDRYIEEALKYLDAAEKAEVGIFLGVPREVVRTGDVKSLMRIIKAVKDKKALWFWYLMDEPSGRDHRKLSLVKAMKSCYYAIRKSDPNHPVIITDARGYRKYFKYCNLIWTDIYPFPDESYMPIAAKLKEAKKEQPDKAVWSVLQAHDLSIFMALKKQKKKIVLTDKDHRPSAKEIRSQAHFAIAEGSRGGVAFYWMPGKWHNMKKNTPVIWKALCDLGSELNSLNDALVSEEKAPELKFSVNYPDYGDQSGWVTYWCRKVGKKIYIGVVNGSFNSNVEVKLTFPDRISRISRLPGSKTIVKGLNGKIAIEAAPGKVDFDLNKLAEKNALTMIMNSSDVAVWCVEL